MGQRGLQTSEQQADQQLTNKLTNYGQAQNPLISTKNRCINIGGNNLINKQITNKLTSKTGQISAALALLKVDLIFKLSLITLYMKGIHNLSQAGISKRKLNGLLSMGEQYSHPQEGI